MLQFVLVIGSFSAVLSKTTIAIGLRNKDINFQDIQFEELEDEEVVDDEYSIRNDPFNTGSIKQTRTYARHTSPTSCKDSTMKTCKRMCVFG